MHRKREICCCFFLFRIINDRNLKVSLMYFIYFFIFCSSQVKENDKNCKGRENLRLLPKFLFESPIENNKLFYLKWFFKKLCDSCFLDLIWNNPLCKVYRDFSPHFLSLSLSLSLPAWLPLSILPSFSISLIYSIIESSDV